MANEEENFYLQRTKGTSNEARDEYKAAFKVLDLDDDGKITVDELHQTFQSLQFNFSRTDITELIGAIDENNDGEIDIDEFITMMAQGEAMVGYQPKTYEQRLHDAFNLFDVNGDGSITANELQGIMLKLGEVISTADIEWMMEHMDENNDGEIDFAEFKAMMSVSPVAS